MNLDEVMKTIKTYCEAREGCEGCYFDRDESCFFALCDLPCDWGIE